MRTPVALLLMLSLCACDDGPAGLDLAKKQYAEGKVDAALATLDGVKQTTPDGADAKEAKGLATRWLLAAAASEKDPDKRRKRYTSALAWSPDSGQAQAHLCLELAKAKRDLEAKQCLDSGLTGKKDPPNDIVKQAKALLASRAKTATKAKPVARNPKGKTGSESLCTDLALYKGDFDKGWKVVEELRDEQLPKLAAIAKLEDQLFGYEDLGKDVRKRAKAFKRTAMDADDHRMKPTEGDVKKLVAKSAWAQYDLIADLGDKLKRPDIESNESYRDTVKAAVASWKRAIETTRTAIDADMKKAREACADPPDQLGF